MTKVRVLYLIFSVLLFGQSCSAFAVNDAPDKIEDLTKLEQITTQDSLESQSNIQAMDEAEKALSDEEILQSLDNFGDQVDNDIFIIEQQGATEEEYLQQPEVNTLKPINQQQLNNNDVNQNQAIDELLIEEDILEEDILEEDSFDDVDLDMILAEEFSGAFSDNLDKDLIQSVAKDLSQDKIIKKLPDDLSLISADKLESMQVPINKSTELGVGVIGSEEKLINTLDKSDLMDFEKKIDVWGKDVIEEIDIEDIDFENNEFEALR